MLQKSMIVFGVLFIFLAASAGAISITNTTVNSTKLLVSVSDAVNLYAYEINFEYTGSGSVTSTNAQFFRFLGASGPTTGVNQKDTTVSVYESILSSSSPGVNGSGNLFNISYFSGELELATAVLIFANGTEMTIDFNTGEVVVTPGPTSGGGGGGSASSARIQGPFGLDEDIIYVETFPDESVWKEVILKNYQGRPITIDSIDIEGLDTILTINEESITLGALDSQEVNLRFDIPRDMVSDVYTGRVLFHSSGENHTAILSVVVEVEDVEGALFDVVVSFPRGMEFSPGDEVSAKIEVDNFGSKRGFDFDLFYAIKTFEGKTVTFANENIAIDTKVELIRELQLPSDLPVGDYIFTAKASHEDAVASGSKTFSVRGVALSPFTGNTFLIILGVAIAVVIIVVVIIVFYVRGRRKVVV